MSRKARLRLISCVMLVIAIIFVLCALSAPNLGSVFYIFGFPIGAEIWRAFYALYAVVMVGLFAASFFVKGGKPAWEE